ncbi:unnamed protein product [Rhizophagus irregularis]|nr:unnamed protein product [Rhizophagus irregularis]
MTETKPPTSNAGEDVLQFLETLDNYSQTTATNQETGGQPPADTQSVLDFLDQFANAQNNSSTKGGDNQSSLAEQPEQPPQPPPQQQKQNQQQISSETQEQKQEGAWSWGGTDLRNLGLSTLTTVVNAVVPPISQYEIVEVWLTHDMVEGGDIVVRKGNESKSYDSEDEVHRELNVCEGFIEAGGIAKANIEQMIKKHYKPPPSINEKIKEQDQQELLRDIPTTTSPVFMAIQPTKANPCSLPTNSETSTDSEKYLFYVIVLTDPTHKLTFKTVSQALPVSWLDIPHEEMNGLS